MSLMSVLSVGNRALQASQMGIDVTGQNISNAGVEGYSRKRVNQTSMYAYDSTYGQMGLGARVVNVERLRNTFLDEQIRKQNSEIGYFAAVSSAFDRMESILHEPGDLGVMYYMDEFFNSWQNLSNNPEDVAARTLVRTNAQIMIDTFRKTALELSNLREQQNEQMPMHVDRINQITAQIMNLNQEVAAVEIGNQHANDSRDRREVLLKELSQYIDINVIENDMGMVTVTTAGHVLIAPSYKQNIEVNTIKRELEDGTVVHDIGLRFSDSRIDFIPTGGQLRGMFDNRDVYVPEYQKKLDELAAAIVKAVNDIHVEGYNLQGVSGFHFFDPIDLKNPGKVTASTIALSAAVKSNVHNIAAATALQAVTDGRNTIAVPNPTATPPVTGYAYGDAPIQLMQAPLNPDMRAYNVITDSVVITVKTKDGIAIPGSIPLVLEEGKDYVIDYTLGTFQMLHDGYDNEEFDIQFNYFRGGFEGPGGNKNALAIAELRNAMTMTPDGLGNPTATFTEYFSSVVGRLGLNSSQAMSNLETRVFLAAQYETQQDAIAGVSLDEEMANLIKYQHTYTAAARLITTVDRMLDTLLNM
ncbi:MAG: flagellar hook-associated protein FlgK [Chitinispirillia bacterium]|nr:flagellar hook-associated protein FlgK [Chitinispirillia bacterium]MCL2269670.1 flagellar hook-associated protein FlgK [Chitinispirillia bacterium]